MEWPPPKGSLERRLLLALSIYAAATGAFLAFAAPETLAVHTPYNHFALQADAWLAGRLDLGGPPPSYAGNNDFSRFDGKWYVPFPPFPALLILPLVWLAGSAEHVADGRFFLLLSGIAPAGLFLSLEKLSRLGRSARSQRENATLALLFAFGTVYFFSAVQGTVWYAAHVVAAGLAALYLLFALEAQRPLLAGTMLALGFATRTPLLFAAPLFVFELARVCFPDGMSLATSPGAALAALDRRRFAKELAWFALPVAVVLGITFALNAARFGDPFEVGYRYLEVVWRARIEKWGLFSFHYLGRNLAVVLTSLPWLGEANAPFRVTGHGLALWVTTPFYFWLLWPKRTRAPHLALAVTAALVALPSLFYQNSGWVQFGYRFSNDYAVFLFALFAVGGRRTGAAFAVLGAWAIVVNAFGAATFNRAEGAPYYVIERTQRVIFEPD
jgi:hypothetical protein